jgi:chromosome segregation ATPase
MIEEVVLPSGVTNSKMPASGKTRNTTKTTKTGTTAKTGTKATTKSTDSAVTYVRQGGERAVDVPIGAVLTARDRLNDVVEPWAKSETRVRELKGLRDQARRELRKFERRGGQARRNVTRRVRRTGTRVEQRVRKVETSVKRNRSRVEDGLRKAQTSVQERVSALA